MAINSDILASTLEQMRDEAIDELFIQTPLIQAWEKTKGLKHGIEQLDGGSSITVPISVRDHSVATDFVDGGEPLVLVGARTLEKAVYLWAHRGAPVIMTKKDMLENTGPQAKVKLMKVKMDSVLRMLRQDLNKKLIANAPAGIMPDLTTLFGFSDGNGSTTGIFEEDDFGSQTNTVGGVSKSAFPTAWQHQKGDAGDAFGTNGRQALDLLIGDCQQYTDGSGPHLILFNRSGYANLRKVLTAVEMYEGAADVKAFGYGKLTYNGIPVAYDINMPAQSGSTADEELTAYVLNLDNIRLQSLKGGWFDVGPWQSLMAGGFSGEGVEVRLAVALTADKLTSSGVLVDGNTY